MSMATRTKQGDRIRQHVGLSISDNEYAAIKSCYESLGMCAAEFFANAINAYAGEQLVRPRPLSRK